MPDIVDVSQKCVEFLLDRQIARSRWKFIPPSAHHCVTCSLPIPQARRKAIPGVKACIKCQRLNELKNTNCRYSPI